MWGVIRRFHSDESGAPAMETVLILAMVSLPIIIGLIVFGGKLWEKFKQVAKDVLSSLG